MGEGEKGITEPPVKDSGNEEDDAVNFWKIFLDKWVPALITAGIGGAIVAFLVPQIQASYSAKAARSERQIRLWESIGANFTNFTNSNFQLVTVAQEIRKTDSSAAPTDLLKRRE